MLYVVMVHKILQISWLKALFSCKSIIWVMKLMIRIPWNEFISTVVSAGKELWMKTWKKQTLEKNHDYIHHKHMFHSTTKHHISHHSTEEFASNTQSCLFQCDLYKAESAAKTILENEIFLISKIFLDPYIYIYR